MHRPGVRDPDEVVEEVVESIERDGDPEELTRGTVVFEEDEEYEEEEEPSELDFETTSDRLQFFDPSDIADAVEFYD